MSRDRLFRTWTCICPNIGFSLCKKKTIEKPRNLYNRNLCFFYCCRFGALEPVNACVALSVHIPKVLQVSSFLEMELSCWAHRLMELQGAVLMKRYFNFFFECWIIFLLSPHLKLSVILLVILKQMLGPYKPCYNYGWKFGSWSGSCRVSWSRTPPWKTDDLHNMNRT